MGSIESIRCEPSTSSPVTEVPPEPPPSADTTIIMHALSIPVPRRTPSRAPSFHVVQIHALPPLTTASGISPSPVARIASVMSSLPNTPSVTVPSCLWDTGNGTGFNLVSMSLAERISHELNTPLQPVTKPITIGSPLKESATYILSQKLTVELRVIDACNLVHYAVVDLYPAAIAPCDIIIDVNTMWLIFQQFSFNPLNWSLTPNPFTPEACDEDLFELSPESLLGALDRMDAVTMTSDVKLVYKAACKDARQLAALARSVDADTPEVSQLATSWLDAAVSKYPSVFMAPAGDGISDVIVTVTTHNLPPELKQKVRSIRRDLVDRVRAELDKYTKQNLHYTSDSKFSSPLVPVVKPDGDIRLCVDYTRLNAYITSPATPIPKIFTMVQDISEFSYYAEVDLSKAYRQLKLDKFSAELLSYVTPFGQFAPRTLTEGIRSAPHIFTHVINEILFDRCRMSSRHFKTYFDNVYICAQSPEELHQHVCALFEACDKFNIKLKRDKCTLCTQRLYALGYVITPGKVQADPARVEGLATLAVPTTREQLLSVLGSFNFYSHLVPNYASAAASLYDLTKKDVPFIWTSVHQASFDILKTDLQRSVGLCYPDNSLDWIVRSDASTVGVGAALIQIRPTDTGLEEEIIAVTSKKLSASATRWSVYDLELYGMILALKSWKHLLLGKRFIVEIDHKNLLYVAKSETPKVVRWRTFLGEFDCDIRHIPGETNLLPDMLSRLWPKSTAEVSVAPVSPTDPLPVDPHPPDDTQLHALVQGVDVPEALYDLIVNTHLGFARTSHYPKHQLLSLIEHHVAESELWKHSKWKRRSNLWPVIESVVSECPICQLNLEKARTLTKQYRSLQSEESFAVIGMDIVGPFPRDIHGMEYIMVITDHFDRVCCLYPLANREEENYLRCLLQYVSYYNIPKFVHSDNEQGIISRMCTQFNQMMRITATTTVPYNPQMNAIVERKNQEVNHKLRIFVQQEKIQPSWSTALPVIQCALNNSYNRVIGMTPFKLRFGSRHAVYPNMLDVNVQHKSKAAEFLRAINEAIESVNLIANIISDLVLSKGITQNLDLQEEVKVGDYVLVEFPERPTSKLSPRYQGPYKVLKIENNIFTLKNKSKAKEFKVDVHHVRKFNADACEKNVELAEEIANLNFSHPEILEHRGIKDEQTQNAEFLVKFNKLATPIWAPLSYMNVKAYEHIFMSYCFKFKELHPLIGIDMKWKLTKESMITPITESRKASNDSMLSHGPTKESTTPSNINPKVKFSSKVTELKVDIKEIKTNKHRSKVSKTKETMDTDNDQETSTDSPMRSTRTRTNRGVNPRYLP